MITRGASWKKISHIVKPKYIAVFALALIISAELLARYWLGLGTPPLSITHPTIEYMFKPDQDVYRFHNHFMTNHFGMRSEMFPPRKNKGELRVMVFGDSVINGGNLTDQKDLATSILEEKLKHAGYDNVIVGNISAGSWGPGNWLAYTRQYGFFDADMVVLVISSHDYADNPTFAKLDPNTHPTRMPISALLEGAERYLPRYLPHLGGAEHGDYIAHHVSDAAVQRGQRDLTAFLDLAKSQAKSVLVFQNLEKDEISTDKYLPGYAQIAQTCRREGIKPISLAPYYVRAIKGGQNPYRDNIHPNDVGQLQIAAALMDYVPHELGLILSGQPALTGEAVSIGSGDYVAPRPL